MNKSNFIYLFVLLAGMVYLNACKKKEDPAPTRKEMLASASGKKWRATSVNVNSSDVFSPTPACYRDNLYVFYTDNKLVTDEGASKCASNNPQTADTGTWSLSTDEKNLTLNFEYGGLFGGEFTITEMSSTTLKGTRAGQNSTMNVTLTAQ